MSKAGQSRITWIDTAKGFGLILVMLGHCYLERSYTFWFTSFHMTLFFFLSGYTLRLKSKNYYQFLKRKALTLVVPYFFLAFITMLCEGTLAITHGHYYEVGKIAILYVVQKRYTLLWFLACLFVGEQLAYPLLYINKDNRNVNAYLIAGLLFGAVFFAYKKTVKNDLPWNADLAILAASVLLFGVYCRESHCLNSITCKWWAGCVSFAICIVLSTIQVHFYGAVDWYSNAFGNPLVFCLSAISGTIAVVCFSSKIQIQALQELGKNSLVYYGLHRIIIDLSFALYGKTGIHVTSGTPSAFFWAMISVALAIIVLTPFNLVVNKLAPWALGKSYKR